MDRIVNHRLVELHRPGMLVLVLVMLLLLTLMLMLLNDTAAVTLSMPERMARPRSHPLIDPVHAASPYIAQRPLTCTTSRAEIAIRPVMPRPCLAKTGAEDRGVIPSH